ncbi:transposase [Streptomyces sp. NPDC005533]|uniref:transposase n=1 Tax=Streptomyces sp. NPDC005533 TaxID=3364723 RepID=UPI003681C0B1
MSEQDCIGPIDGMRQLVRAPIMLVWDRLNTHVSHVMRELSAGLADAFILPSYAPELHVVEFLWAHVKRSLAHLTSAALDQLEAADRIRLRRLQYRPHVPDGVLAGTSLSLDSPPPSP